MTVRLHLNGCSSAYFVYEVSIIVVFFNLRGNIVSVISLLTRYNNLYVLIENYEKIKIGVTFS